MSETTTTAPEWVSLNLFHKFESKNEQLAGNYCGIHRQPPARNADGSLQKFIPQHIVQTPEGFVYFNTSTKLSKLLAPIPPGCPIQVTYLGKVKVGNNFQMADFDLKIPAEYVEAVGREMAKMSAPQATGQLLLDGMTIDESTGEIISNTIE